MATKSADKKKSITTAAVAHAPEVATSQSALERTALEYLTWRIQQFLVSYGESARLGDIASGLAEDGASPGLVRHVLGQHPSRFLYVDRRWDVRTRFLDRQRPTSKLLEEIVANYEAPIAAWDAAHELGAVIGRSPEGTRTMVERLLRSTGLYAPMVTDQGGQIKYGLASWLLDIRDEYLTDSDVLFYNFLSPDATAPFEKIKVDWESDPVSGALSILAATSGSPKTLDNRLLLFLAYKQLDDDFDGVEIYNALAGSSKLFWLPGHRWTDEAGLSAIRAELARLSEHIAELPEEEEPVEEEQVVPLSVSAADLDEMFRIISGSEVAVSAATLLQDVYDSSPGERTYNQDLEIVLSALRSATSRFQWVGYDRFRAANSLPPYIGQVPESLQFPIVPQIPNSDEDLLDQLLEDEGFERGLERDIRNPVAMDVNDQDAPETAIWPNGESADSRTIRLVLKAHHKEIGTFPLCQIPSGFITTEPTIVELMLRDARGVEYQVFADYDTQLIYGIGLFDLYSTIESASGAVFSLEKTATAGEYRFISNEETDDNFYITPERMEQLQNYRAEIEDGPATSTHDIVRYILEHSNSAMSYLALLAEVNIVRRVTRRQLASILSGWASFSQKGGLWSFDAKKASQGFNKTKRKYML